MDDQDVRKRGLLSSMLELFGPEPQDRPKEAAEEAPEPPDSASAEEASVEDAPAVIADPSVEPEGPREVGGFRPVPAYAPPEQPPQQPPRPAAPAAPRVSDPMAISQRVADMLASTEALTRDLTARAEEEAGSIVAGARREAEAALAGARHEADEMVLAARAEAAAIVAAGEQAGDDARAAAEEESEAIRSYARRNAAMLVQAAQSNRAQVQRNLEHLLDQSRHLSSEFLRNMAALIEGAAGEEAPAVEEDASGAVA